MSPRTRKRRFSVSSDDVVHGKCSGTDERVYNPTAYKRMTPRERDEWASAVVPCIDAPEKSFVCLRRGCRFDVIDTANHLDARVGDPFRIVRVQSPGRWDAPNLHHYVEIINPRRGCVHSIGFTFKRGKGVTITLADAEISRLSRKKRKFLGMPENGCQVISSRFRKDREGDGTVARLVNATIPYITGLSIGDLETLDRKQIKFLYTFLSKSKVLRSAKGSALGLYAPMPNVEFSVASGHSPRLKSLQGLQEPGWCMNCVRFCQLFREHPGLLTGALRLNENSRRFEEDRQELEMRLRNV